MGELHFQPFPAPAALFLHIATVFSDHKNHWKLNSFDVTFQKGHFYGIWMYKLT